MFYLLLWRVVAWYWLALNWWAYITVSKRDYLFEIQLQTETWPRVKAAHNLAAVFKCQSVSLIFNEIKCRCRLQIVQIKYFITCIVYKEERFWGCQTPFFTASKLFKCFSFKRHLSWEGSLLRIHRPIYTQQSSQKSAMVWTSLCA